MLLSEIAAIIEAATPYQLLDIRTFQHGLRANIGVLLADYGAAEATITISALDMEQARYPADLIRTLTRDATEKLRRFLAGENTAVQIPA